MSSDATVARKVVVHGRVQGVFFRAGCADEAERLGVRGWVRNEPDGTVAGHFEGSSAAVDALVAWCHHGPPLARVTHVEATVSQPTGASGFRAR